MEPLDPLTRAVVYAAYWRSRVATEELPANLIELRLKRVLTILELAPTDIEYDAALEMLIALWRTS